MIRVLRNVMLLGGVLLLSACATTYQLPEKAVPVTVGPVFTDHMVLQRELPVRVWGKANPGEPVKVMFAGCTRRAVADTNGNWSVLLAPMKASAESRPLLVQGHNEVKIEDVLVGEVWLCSGQSNMEWGFLGVPSGMTDVKTANFPQLRLFSVDKRTAAKPQENFKGSNGVNHAKGWVTCSPANIIKVGTHEKSFSATALYFGMELQAKLGIPVGLIQSAWGGSRIEPWTPRMDAAKGDGSMYNAMVAPLTPMTIRGAIWYQGEANRGDKGAYEAKMKDLISAWRSVFQRPDMPFYFVEIAPYRYKSADESTLGELRAAQARVAAAVPHTGMIHTLDNPNDLGNIHPINKRQTGERLARLALANTYGVKGGKSIVGPAFASAARDGAGVLVSFTETADALTTVDGKTPVGFEGLQAVGKWAPASAEIRGDKVWVSVVGQTLSAVRFCWLETQQTNLRNAEGFPPSPFNAVLPKTVE